MPGLAAREVELLDVPYVHVVFTLPHTLSPLALQNPRVIYNLLFQAVAETLLTVARDPHSVGADIGFLAVLHTWGQTLHHHPHLHCVVPGGGLSPDGTQWVACRPAFFLPVRVLSRVFRRLFLTLLRQAYTAGARRWRGSHTSRIPRGGSNSWPPSGPRSGWYAGRHPGWSWTGAEVLARWRRIAWRARIGACALEEGRVTFRWKDYAHGNRQRLMTLDAVEFIRRFLLHILPAGFQRLRHYGLLANRVRQAKLRLCRVLLQPVSATLPVPPGHPSSSSG